MVELKIDTTKFHPNNLLGQWSGGGCWQGEVKIIW